MALIEMNEGARRANDLMDRERQQEQFERRAKANETTNQKLDRVIRLLEGILFRVSDGQDGKR